MNYKNIKQLASRHPFVLASRSPRRVGLLEEMGITFTQIIPNLDETKKPDEPPYRYAQRLAECKALAIASQVNDNHVILGCDTIVVLQEQILQKPSSEEDAFAILSLLSGKQHTVCTALALAKAGEILTSDFELTDVYFNVITPQQIRDYIATKEPMDKAGAYGIQGMGAFLVDRIAGNVDNVIGLPRTLLDTLAQEAMKRLTD